MNAIQDAVVRPLALACLMLLAPAPAGAAYISEIDLGGPAGRGIELSSFDDDTGATLLVMDASATTPTQFGFVWQVIDVPGSTANAVSGTVMLTENTWPDQPALTTAVGSMNLNASRLIAVVEGSTDLSPFDNPTQNATAKDRWDQSNITDWLILSTADAATYQANHDLSALAGTLGFDPLDRLVDPDAGRIVARTNEPVEPGQPINPIDMDRFFVGDPDPTGQFAVSEQYNYAYTPGQSNLPLIVVPEPGTAAALLLGGAVLLRRRRQA